MGVFNPEFVAYNNSSGVIQVKINLGKVPQPPHKSRITLYMHSDLQLLQEEYDNLEALGVLAKPEGVGVDVVYSSPSLLVKKPSGGYRLYVLLSTSLVNTLVFFQRLQHLQMKFCVNSPDGSIWLNLT